MSWTLTTTAVLVFLFVPLAYSQNSRSAPPPRPQMSSERVIATCSQRLDAEMVKIDPQPEVILNCLYQLKSVDGKIYARYVNELQGLYRRLVSFNPDRKKVDDSFFVFVKALTETVSVKDGLELALKLLSNHPRIQELPFVAVAKLEPLTFIQFYNKNEKAIVSAGINRLENVISTYCIAAVIQGEPEACISRLTGYEKTSPQPWLKILLAAAYVEQGNAQEAEKQILSVTLKASPEESDKQNPQCPQFGPALIRGPLVMAQIYKQQGKLALSKACLGDLAKKSKDGSFERSFHTLEMAKLSRFENLVTSDQYITRGITSAGSSVLFRLLLDMEALKNLAIQGNKEAFAALKVKLNAALKSTTLKKHQMLINHIEKHLLNDDPTPVVGSSADILELRALIQLKKRLKPVTPKKDNARPK